MGSTEKLERQESNSSTEKLERQDSNSSTEKLERQESNSSTFSNSSWCEESSSCQSWDMQSGCTGPPDLSAYRKWNRGGMFDFESSNGMGWKGGNWPPR